ncbi:voltage-gated potassium channel [Aureococcus anophagefferens]|nr:voltage-gated potassium channel [Aureococcus anophagefferens]
MGEPPRDGKKNDVQREDEIRRLQEMVSSLQAEQSRGAEEPESIEELTHRSLESIHDSKGREGKKGSFLLHKARKPKLDEKVNASTRLPKQPRRRVFPVQDPRTDALRLGRLVDGVDLLRHARDAVPDQLHAPDDFVDNFTAGDPPGYNKYIVLAVLNGVVDIMFFADLCLCFNTAFFEDNEWAVCKYIAILLFLLHWTACAIRMIAAVTLDDCHKKRGGLELAPGQRLRDDGRLLHDEPRRGVLCLIVGLVGCIVMAFLIGDLCNVVGNMDPVGNDYTMTLDMLNSYLDEQNTPPALRMKLREYMGLAEKARDEQHKRILGGSPTLKAIVAHQNLGREVARIGFYEQAVRRTFRLYPGTRFAVYPKSKNRQDRPGPLRPCVITHVDDALLFSVRYDDDQSEEHDLVHSRVDVHSYELGFAFERDINRFIYEHDNFVLAVSHLLSTKFFMDRDFLIHQNMTPNEEMYVIQNGRCICWGEKRRRATGACFARMSPEDMTIGEDICMLTVGDKKPRPRLYTVRACATTEVYALSGVDFVALMDEGMFYAFPKHMRAYGCWQMIRYDLIRRSRELVDHRRIGAVSVLEIVPEAATVVPPEINKRPVDYGGYLVRVSAGVAKRADEPTEHDGDTDDDGVADDDADGAALVARVPGPS